MPVIMGLFANYQYNYFIKIFIYFTYQKSLIQILLILHQFLLFFLFSLNCSISFFLFPYYFLRIKTK